MTSRVTASNKKSRKNRELFVCFPFFLVWPVIPVLTASMTVLCALCRSKWVSAPSLSHSPLRFASLVTLLYATVPLHSPSCPVWISRSLLSHLSLPQYSPNNEHSIPLPFILHHLFHRTFQWIVLYHRHLPWPIIWNYLSTEFWIRIEFVESSWFFPYFYMEISDKKQPWKLRQMGREFPRLLWFVFWPFFLIYFHLDSFPQVDNARFNSS